MLVYGARFYDPAIARFTTVDPLAEQYSFQNPYAYAANNPIKYIDYMGMGPEHIIVGENDDGTYKITGGKRDGDRGIYLDDGNGEKGEKIGMTTTDYSFFLENDEVVMGANIDLSSSEGQDFLYEIIDSDISLRKYAANARGGQPLDFKTNDIDERSPGISPQQYKHRGSKLADGTIASARDVGNIAAGIVAGKNGLSWGMTRFGFDLLESYQQRGNFSTVNGPFVVEGAVSRTAQYKGYELGVLLRNNPVTKNGPKSTYEYKVN